MHIAVFSNEEPITIQIDASSIGVSAALMQQGKGVSYHSRALTKSSSVIQTQKGNAMDL